MTHRDIGNPMKKSLDSVEIQEHIRDMTDRISIDYSEIASKSFEPGVVLLTLRDGDKCKLSWAQYNELRDQGVVDYAGAY